MLEEISYSGKIAFNFVVRVVKLTIMLFVVTVLIRIMCHRAYKHFVCLHEFLWHSGVIGMSHPYRFFMQATK